MAMRGYEINGGYLGIPLEFLHIPFPGRTGTSVHVHDSYMSVYVVGDVGTYVRTVGVP
jgi:hypothetical protein